MSEINPLVIVESVFFENIFPKMLEYVLTGQKVSRALVIHCGRAVDP
jgi:hypothetical protein